MSNSYATLAVRVRASLIDGLIVLCAFISLPFIFSDVFNSPSVARVFILWGPVLTLEPLLIAYWGCTIGQYIHGIKVVSIETSGKCSLADSFIRYYCKMFLGFLSMLYILFSAQKRAIHDKIARTVVITSDSAESQDSGSDLDSNYEYPSAFRRFVVFVGWYVISIFSTVILFFILVHIVANPKNGWPKWTDQWSSVIDMVLLIGLAMLAGEGYLPGARRKIKKTETE